MKRIIALFVTVWLSISLLGQISTFTDSRDDQVYNKVTIGTQIWMAENLNYDSDTSYCYTQDTASCTVYGRLYPWEQIHDSLCPSGWHLPTDAEWRTLEVYLGMSATAASLTGYRLSGGVGELLKSATGWTSEGIGLDTYLLGILPAGFRKPGGNYVSQGYNALFWTDTAINQEAVSRMFFYQKGIGRNLYNKQYSASVRCVKD